MTETLRIEVQSESDPSRKYTVHALGGEAVCSCPGFTTHGHCKHVEGVKKIMAEDHDSNNTALAVRDQAPPPIVADVPPTALLPTRTDLEAMALIAGQAIKASGMIPANLKTKEQALAVMLAGWELGLRPMTALRHVYVVNGKTEIETRAMVGIIRARRPEIQFAWPEYTSEAVTCIIRRPGQPETQVRYSRADAEASGQMAKGGVWKSYTRDMLYAAATKRACRLACPDLINAIEGAMSTEAEAVSLMMPDADVRELADVESTATEIPTGAFNDGDDGALSPEVAADDQPAVRQSDDSDARRAAQHRTGRDESAQDVRPQISKLYQRVKDELSSETQAEVYEELVKAGAITAEGKSNLSKISHDEAVRLRDLIKRKLDGDGPPAGEAEQGELV